MEYRVFGVFLVAATFATCLGQFLSYETHYDALNVSRDERGSSDGKIMGNYTLTGDEYLYVINYTMTMQVLKREGLIPLTQEELTKDGDKIRKLLEEQRKVLGLLEDDQIPGMDDSKVPNM